MTQQATPTRYVRAGVPVDAAGLRLYTVSELTKVATSIASFIDMVPQVAIAVPKTPSDGMIRLARSPWHPAAGQSTDAWVYYDAPSGTWKLL
jgi:hypothetical protein